MRHGRVLITAMNHVISEIERQERKKWKANVDAARKSARSRVAKYAQKFIVGIDFNPELVKATKMNMVMNNDGAGGLYQANSLEAPTSWLDDAARARKLRGRVDLLFTNPPFGSKIPVTDPSVLEQYDLGYRWALRRDRRHLEEGRCAPEVAASRASLHREVRAVLEARARAGPLSCSPMASSALLGLATCESGSCATRKFSRVSICTPIPSNPS